MLIPLDTLGFGPIINKLHGSRNSKGYVMRLMIVGQLEGYISAAGKIALQRGAKGLLERTQVQL